MDEWRGCGGLTTKGNFFLVFFAFNYRRVKIVIRGRVFNCVSGSFFFSLDKREVEENGRDEEIETEKPSKRSFLANKN